MLVVGSHLKYSHFNLNCYISSSSNIILIILCKFFGNYLGLSKDFNKSISLNWWCETPNDFSENIYNHSTEIYFVGKLFEKAIVDNDIEVFGYKEILNQMIKFDKKDRIKSFNDIF